MKWSLAVLLSIVAVSPAWANEPMAPDGLSLYPLYKTQLHLAEAATPANSSRTAVEQDVDERAFDNYRPPLFSANKLHQYLGIGSITLATLALLSPKDDDSAHGAFGAGAAALGGAAVVSGLIVHGEDVGFSQGLSDPDNLHAIFGTLGAAGFIAAASVGGEKEKEDGDGEGSDYHAALGIAGYTAMLIGIRIAW